MATIDEQRSLRISRWPSGPSSGGKVLKLSKLMGALILAGVVQGALDAQDVLRAIRFT